MRALLDLQRRERPDVLFLSETHLGTAKAEILRKKLQFDHLSIFESDGPSYVMEERDSDLCARCL